MSLLDYGRNKIYLDELKSNITNVVPFLGAGASMPYGYPSWSELLIKILDNICDVTRITDETYKRIQNCINEKQYMKAADSIYRHWPNLEDFVCSEISIIKPNPDSCSCLAEYIHLFPSRLYLTTNYDSVVETILQSYFGNSLNVGVITSPIPSSMGLRNVLTREKPTLLYLHGNYTEPSSIIFTEVDYNDFYGSTEVTCNKAINRRTLAKKIQEVYSRDPLLFLGCGMNLEEDRILKLLQRFNKMGQPPPCYSYALLDMEDLTPDQIDQKENMLLSIRVHPIWYSFKNGMDHEQVKKELFEHILREEREKYENWRKSKQEEYEMEQKKQEEEIEKRKRLINEIEEFVEIKDRIPYYQKYYSSGDDYEFLLINVTVNNQYYLSDQGRTYKMLDQVFELKEADVIKNLIAIAKECGVLTIRDKLLLHLESYGELPENEQQILLEEAKCKLFTCVSFMDKMRIFYV